MHQTTWASVACVTNASYQLCEFHTHLSRFMIIGFGKFRAEGIVSATRRALDGFQDAICGGFLPSFRIRLWCCLFLVGQNLLVTSGNHARCTKIK